MYFGKKTAFWVVHLLVSLSLYIWFSWLILRSVGSLLFSYSYTFSLRLSVVELFLLSSGWLCCSHLLFAWHWACSCSWALWCSCWKFFSVCGPLEKIFQLDWWTTLPSIFFVSFWNWLVLLSQIMLIFTWSSKKASLLFLVSGLDNSCMRKNSFEFHGRYVTSMSIGLAVTDQFLRKNVSWKYCGF